MSRPTAASNPLANPELRTALLLAAKRRGMGSDAEDVVQGVLLEALSSNVRPTNPNELERWLRTVLRNKIVDHYRRNRREKTVDELPEVGVEEPDMDLLKWAMTELPDGAESPKALEWALREGSGEKLEHIAEQESLPAPRVRQRVVRLRQHFRLRWALYAAAVGVAMILALGALARRKPVEIARDTDTPELRGKRVRQRAFEECPQLSPEACLERLDEAKRLDPAGDTEPATKTLRDALSRKFIAPPIPAPSSSTPTDISPERTAPSSSALPMPVPTTTAPASAAPMATMMPPLSVPYVPRRTTSNEKAPYRSSEFGGSDVTAPAPRASSTPSHSKK